ncbi:hypothetical protein KSB_60270 [Ktedonobacter robiniae]|uniref:Uncharacterized protein n=1 Tax=Ktedonobacter robiniae TaxID=2778365 RepID=A0ABQ3UYX0_9CHLR|nr:hypothetical protein KSB_60270 [Ktedonobacter robiniae]
MAALLLIELQSGCEAVQNLIRNANVSALFEPRIPIDAHADQLGKLFARKSARSSPRIRWKAKLFWTQTRATAFEEIA